MSKNKLGQVTGIGYGFIGVIVLFMLVGIVIFLGQKSISVMKNTVTADQSTTASNNQSLTWAGNNTAIGFLESTVTAVTLYNNGSVVNQGDPTTGNYSITSNGITILNQSGATWGITNNGGNNQCCIITSALNLTYSYTYGSQERNITKQQQVGLESISKFQPTIGTIIAIGVILTLLIGLSVMIYRKVE